MEGVTKSTKNAQRSQREMSLKKCVVAFVVPFVILVT